MTTTYKFDPMDFETLIDKEKGAECNRYKFDPMDFETVV